MRSSAKERPQGVFRHRDVRGEPVGCGKSKVGDGLELVRVGRDATLLNLESNLLDLAAGKLKFLEAEGDPSAPGR
ncbi:hypothetical protein OUZ56_011860 [Daphnia magna]|uniref:Uncharacterized protein n=1 Tax=Daphnia magna TaxID=35525 RepID=A0ABQ9Z1I0_9CRUS|nr:hypothetical protein OUZ56_011860 [Daphnia magna]